jgi:hypothetical protein
VARRTCIEGSGVLVEPCQSSPGRSALDDRDLADLTRVISASPHLPCTAAPRVLPDRLNERPGQGRHARETESDHLHLHLRAGYPRPALHGAPGSGLTLRRRTRSVPNR